MGEVSDPLHRDEVGGVPVFWTQIDGPLTVALTFRVGWVDETLATRGITHIVEHLAMAELGQPEYQCNAFVDLNRVTFYASGSEDQVGEFVSRLTTTLCRLPIARLDTERRVLRSEEASRDYGSLASHLSLRYGVRGYGLGDYPQFGIRRITANELLDWAARYFTRENAAIWLTGPPPNPLSVSLPPGQARTQPEFEALQLHLPCQVAQNATAVAVSMIAERSPEIALASRLMSYRVVRALRLDKGLAYAPGCDYRPLSRTTASVLLHSDALPDQASDVLAHLLGVIGELHREGPNSSEIEHDRVSQLAATHPRESALMELERACRRQLRIDPEELEELGAANAASPVSAKSVQSAVQAAWSTAIVTRPQSSNAVPDMPSYPAWSSHKIPGTSLRRRLQLRSGPPAGTSLSWSSAGGGYLFPQGTTVAARFADVEAVLRWNWGLVVAVARDGFSVRINPWEWVGSNAALQELIAKVPAERFIPMDEPNGLADDTRSSCQVCRGRPTAEVTLMPASIRGLPINGPMCHDCGLALARRNTDRYLAAAGGSMFTPLLIFAPLFLFFAFRNSRSMIKLSRLGPAVREPNIEYWPAGKVVFHRPGVWILLTAITLYVVTAWIILANR
jgi:hypothetical protein